MLNYVRLWRPSWSKGRTAGIILGREPSKELNFDDSRPNMCPAGRPFDQDRPHRRT
jgi:hypothetical protein